MPRLILIRGLPGSGKTTKAKQMIIEGRADVNFEADMFFYLPLRFGPDSYRFDAEFLHDAHRWCQRKTEHALKQGMRVVVSNTFVTKKELQPYLNLVDNEEEVLIIEMKHEFGSIHNVPQETLDRMRRRWYEIEEKVC